MRLFLQEIGRGGRIDIVNFGSKLKFNKNLKGGGCYDGSTKCGTF
jgi:hypothetical protein